MPALASASCLHAGDCFAGNSQVVVQGRPEATVAIRDVRVGDHVMCFEGGSDLLTPGAPRWCQVQGFVSDRAAVHVPLACQNCRAM